MVAGPLESEFGLGAGDGGGERDEGEEGEREAIRIPVFFERESRVRMVERRRTGRKGMTTHKRVSDGAPPGNEERRKGKEKEKEGKDH